MRTEDANPDANSDSNAGGEALVARPAEAESVRAGFVAVIGAPNAGKSTLTNLLVGEKVSIVSAKPQTTRQRITGIWLDEARRSQIIFVDAPGVLESGADLNSFLIDEAKDVIKN